MAVKEVGVTIKGNDQTKAAFDSAHKNAESFGQKLKETLNSPFELLKGLIAVELVRVVGDFFKGTVEAAAESERAWNRVAQSVENAGISFQGVRADLKETFEAISDKTRFSEKEIQDAFGTVLNVSNDYAGSLKNLGLITNIAIAKQMDLNTAATIVGKAMDGQTSLLKRYGIIIKDGADAMGELNKRFSGFAERDGASLQGRLHQVANEWEELKIQVGLAITSTDTARDGAGKLVTVLANMTDALEKNRSAFRQWVTDFGNGWRTIKDTIASAPGVAQFLARRDAVARQNAPGLQSLLDQAGQTGDTPDHGDAGYHNAIAAERARARKATEDQIAANSRQAAADAAQRAADEAEKALVKRIDLIKKEGEEILKIRDLDSATVEDYKRTLGYAADLLKTANDTTKSFRERIAASDELKRIHDAEVKHATELLQLDEKRLALEKNGTSMGALGASGTPIIGAGKIRGGPVAGAFPSIGDPTGGGFVAAFTGGIKDASAGLGKLDESIRGVGETLGNVTSGALVNFIGTWTQGIDDVIHGHEALGVAIVRAVRQAVGGSLIAKGQETLLDAAKAAVMGFSNPAYFLQAAKLFGIASAEIATGSLFSGGGGGSYGGGGGGGVSPAGFSQQQSQNGGNGAATVVVNGKYAQFDFRDPAQRDEFKQFLQALVGNRELNLVFSE